MYKSLAESLRSTRERLDEIVKKFDDDWDSMPDGTKMEFDALTNSENAISKAIGTLPLQVDIDALNDENYSC